MALISIKREEYLLPDGKFARARVEIRVFGIPVYEDSNVSSNENVLSCFTQQDPEPTGFYDTNNIGFKRETNESN